MCIYMGFISRENVTDSISLSCVGITLLLSMTVFQLIIADKVPESSQSIPLVGTPIITARRYA